MKIDMKTYVEPVFDESIIEEEEEPQQQPQDNDDKTGVPVKQSN